MWVVPTCVPRPPQTECILMPKWFPTSTATAYITMTLLIHTFCVVWHTSNINRKIIMDTIGYYLRNLSESNSLFS